MMYFKIGTCNERQKVSQCAQIPGMTLFEIRRQYSNIFRNSQKFQNPAYVSIVLVIVTLCYLNS